MTTKASLIDLNGNEMILDADADTSITADTDDQIDFKVGGTDRLSLKSDGKLSVTEINHISSGTLEIGNGDEKQLFDATEQSIEFQTADSERMRITSDGKVGIGTSTPNYPLVVAGTNPKVQIYDSDGNGQTNLYFGDSGSNLAGYVVYQHSDNAMRFGTDATERMRISGDNVLIKTTDTSQGSGSGVKFVNTRLYMVNALTSGEQISYYGDGGYKYYVGVNGKIHSAFGQAVYAVSDERLKENIRDYDKGLADIVKLKPRLFDWKEGEGSNEKNVSGFVAQECEEAGFDEFVGDFKHDTLTDAKSFGQGGLIPALVKAIQEQQEQIEALQSEINLLKGE
jgi:hypothetical protein